MIDLSVKPNIESNVDTKKLWSKRKKLFTILLFLNAILFGIFICFVNESSLLTLFVGFPFLILTLLWCQADAGEVGNQISFHLRYLILFFSYAGLPIYLFSTGGIKRLLKASLFILSLFAVAILTFIIIFIMGEVFDLWKITF